MFFEIEKYFSRKKAKLLHLVTTYPLYLGLEWKLTFSTPVATAEFSKFAGILSAALSHEGGF